MLAVGWELRWSCHLKSPHMTSLHGLNFSETVSQEWGVQQIQAEAEILLVTQSWKNQNITCNTLCWSSKSWRPAQTQGQVHWTLPLDGELEDHMAGEHVAWNIVLFIFGKYTLPQGYLGHPTALPWVLCLFQASLNAFCLVGRHSWPSVARQDSFGVSALVFGICLIWLKWDLLKISSSQVCAWGMRGVLKGGSDLEVG